MDKDTFFLAGRPSFIDGLARVVDFAGAMNVYSYSKTPEVTDNAHGKTMPEGERARDLVRGMLPPGARVFLWGPGAELERDAYKRLLAVVWAERSGHVGVGGSDAQPATWQENVNLAVIRAGFSPYWRKYGKATGQMHQAFTEAQDSAREAAVGAWATAPDYMRDKANETSAKGR